MAEERNICVQKRFERRPQQETGRVELPVINEVNCRTPRDRRCAAKCGAGGDAFHFVAPRRVQESAFPESICEAEGISDPAVNSPFRRLGRAKSQHSLLIVEAQKKRISPPPPVQLRRSRGTAQFVDDFAGVNDPIVTPNFTTPRARERHELTPASLVQETPDLFSHSAAKASNVRRQILLDNCTPNSFKDGLLVCRSVNTVLEDSKAEDVGMCGHEDISGASCVVCLHSCAHLPCEHQSSENELLPANSLRPDSQGDKSRLISGSVRCRFIEGRVQEPESVRLQSRDSSPLYSNSNPTFAAQHSCDDSNDRVGNELDSQASSAASPVVGDVSPPYHCADLREAKQNLHRTAGKFLNDDLKHSPGVFSMQDPLTIETLRLECHEQSADDFVPQHVEESIQKGYFQRPLNSPTRSHSENAKNNSFSQADDAFRGDKRILVTQGEPGQVSATQQRSVSMLEKDLSEADACMGVSRKRLRPPAPAKKRMCFRNLNNEQGVGGCEGAPLKKFYCRSLDDASLSISESRLEAVNLTIETLPASDARQVRLLRRACNDALLQPEHERQSGASKLGEPCGADVANCERVGRDRGSLGSAEYSDCMLRPWDPSSRQSPEGRSPLFSPQAYWNEASAERVETENGNVLHSSQMERGSDCPYGLSLDCSSNNDAAAKGARMQSKGFDCSDGYAEVDCIRGNLESSSNIAVNCALDLLCGSQKASRISEKNMSSFRGDAVEHDDPAKRFREDDTLLGNRVTVRNCSCKSGENTLKCHSASQSRSQVPLAHALNGAATSSSTDPPSDDDPEMQAWKRRMRVLLRNSAQSDSSSQELCDSCVWKVRRAVFADVNVVHAGDCLTNSLDYAPGQTVTGSHPRPYSHQVRDVELS